jgi:peptidyl-prolyl cis-trans isomerase C
MRCMTIWILLAGLLVFSGCSKDEPAGEEPAVDSGGAAKEPQEPLAEGILGEVNGIPVSSEQFLLMIEPYPDRMKENLQGREYVFNALVDHLLLEGEAKRMGLDRDPDYVRKVDSYRRNLLANSLFEKVNEGGFEVTVEEAREYFKAHPEEFDRPEKVQVRHILLADKGDAQKLLKQVRKGGSFEKMAREFSIDASTRDRGGDLGPFTKEQRPELASAAFSLKKPGEVKGPVKTTRGFHLLQLVRRIEAKKDTFEGVKDSLMSRLRARKRQDVKKDLLNRLRQEAQIQVDKQSLEALEIPMGGK